MVKFQPHKIIKSEAGFSLIELIVVLAGLGMLSSLVLPNFIDLLDSNNVDEIKALLNSAAADCLQKKRSTTDPIVDEEIISPDTIRTTGYQIDNINSILDTEGKPKCSLLLLEPIDGDDKDRVRYNIGFQLLGNGKLDKLASTVMEKKKPDCIKWAGKCEFSADAKILEDYKNEIRAARAECNSRFTDWGKNMNPEFFKRWDSTKGPDTCPLSPPGEGDTSYKGTIACTTTGCTKDVWGLWDSDTNTGSTYSTIEAYEKARTELFGLKCTTQIKEKYEDTKFTNPSSAGIRTSECKRSEDIFWFFEGIDKGSAEEWKKEMCTKNKQELLSTTHSGPVEHCDISPIYICGGEEISPDADRDTAKANFATCLDNDKDEKCTAALNDSAVEQSDGGPHTSPTPIGMEAPIGEDCNVQYWYCKDKVYRSKTNYDGDERCATPPSPKSCNRPTRICDIEGNYTYPDCLDYSKCMGRI